MTRRRPPGAPSPAEITLDLVGAAYAAAADPELWPEFARAFERNLSSAVAVYTHPTDAPHENRTLLASGIDPHYAKLYREELHPRNVLILNAARHKAPILLAEDVVDRDDFERSEFFNEYLVPQGLHHAVNLNLVVEGRRRVSLAGMRADRFGAYDEAEREILTRLLPHLKRALQTAERLDLLNAQSKSSFAAFERLAAAVAMVDEDGRVLFANRAAKALFAVGDAFRESGGRLRAVDLTADLRLRAAVSAATALRPVGAAFPIARRNGRTALSVTVTPADPRRSIFAPIRALAMILVHDPAASAGVSEEALRARYDATPTEARLAVALCAGESLAGYAASAEVSVTTVKTHLAGLFAKTGTNRQADLVRLLASDPTLRG